MTDKAGYPQAAFGGDTIRTVTLTPQEQTAYASGWNRAIEAAAKQVDAEVSRLREIWNPTHNTVPRRIARDIRALSMPAPEPAQAWRTDLLKWCDKQEAEVRGCLELNAAEEAAASLWIGRFRTLLKGEGGQL